eukprot:403363451
MQRAKPYRSHPTGLFMELYDIALNLRMYLVQENGPTKLVLEDIHQKKFKVQIGSVISCSCGGGRSEHCVHTIYALVKIFRMEEGDELIWQLSFTDAEIQKIIQNRHAQRGQTWNRQNYGVYNQVYQSGFNLGGGNNNRQQSHSIQPNRRQQNNNHSNFESDNFELPPKKPKAPQVKRDQVNRMILDKDEPCCVCHENMKNTDNLTFCKYGCGRNIHIDCIEVWVKHKLSNNQQITCPLCRTDWGQNVLEELKEETKKNKEQAKVIKEQQIQQQNVTNSIMNQTLSNLPQNDRTFKCFCCKRNLIYEAKYQCVLCEQVEICKICFNSNYHEIHEFIMRPQPDKEWEPAFRIQITSNQNQQNLEQLKARGDLKLEDFQKLLSVETSQKIISLPKYLSLVFEKYYPSSQEYVKMAFAYCNFCELKIEDKNRGLMFKNCDHCVHKGCLEDMFRLKKNHCQICDAIIMCGYEKAASIGKINTNKVLIQKTQFENKQRNALSQIEEEKESPQFGIQNRNQSKLITVKRHSQNGKIQTDSFLDFNFKTKNERNNNQAKESKATSNFPENRFMSNPVDRQSQELNQQIGTFIIPQQQQSNQNNQQNQNFSLLGLGGTKFNTTHQQYFQPSQDFLAYQQQHNENSDFQLQLLDRLRDKKVKDHLRKRDKEARLNKAKEQQQSGNTQLNKYYREQINNGQSLDFLGDLKYDIKQINRSRFKTNQENNYSLIENAIPNIPEEMLHPDFIRLQKLGYFN